MATGAPRVSVLIPVWNGAGTLAAALSSVLAQSVTDFELVVVDDGSDDETPELLGRETDRRLRVVRSERRLGVAGALNLGLDEVTGDVVARMDADDIAQADWLACLLARLRGEPRVAIVGAGLVELVDDGRTGAVHLLPQGVALTRWRSLFGTPFFHNAVAFERAVLVDNGLRYDPALEGAEDFDLWARLLRVARGDVVPRALVRYRSHPAQASTRGAERLLRLRRDVALREIRLVHPALDERRADLAWRVGDARAVPSAEANDAVDALVELLSVFEETSGFGPDAAVRSTVAREIMRLSVRERSPSLARRAVAFDPRLPIRVARDRRLRRREARSVTRRPAPAGGASSELRVTVVSPEPTPYRAPLFDRIASVEGIALTVLYAGASVQQRTWTVEAGHHAVVLEGHRVPGAHRVLRHDYPLTTRIIGALRDSSPDVVVVSGWSMFASQAAVAWCRRTGVPYVLQVESNDRDARAGWRRAVKGAVANPVISGASWTLVVGSLARDSVIERGADPERVSVFANTIDVEAFGARAAELAPRRAELRAELGLASDDVAVLSVARLSPEKGLDTLVRAVAAAGAAARATANAVDAAATHGDQRLVVVLVGDGPERERLVALAAVLGVRLVLAGDVPWERIAERYVAADVFALLSTHEPWGVVVNEAAACGLPLVLSERVGAAHDLLIDGENGSLVAPGEVAATAAALGRFAADPEERERAGAASQRIVASWGYRSSVESFVAAVRAAAAAESAGSAAPAASAVPDSAVSDSAVSDSAVPDPDVPTTTER